MQMLFLQLVQNDIQPCDILSGSFVLLLADADLNPLRKNQVVF